MPVFELPQTLKELETMVDEISSESTQLTGMVDT